MFIATLAALLALVLLLPAIDTPILSAFRFNTVHLIVIVISIQ